MVNAFFNAGREGFATAAVNWVSDTIRATLIDTADDTLSLSGDDFYNDVASAARVATVTLASKTATAGVLDAADATFPTVTGDQSEVVIIDKNTGTESTSRLLIFIDTFSSGMPVTPNGGDINIVWHASGIATL